MKTESVTEWLQHDKKRQHAGKMSTSIPDEGFLPTLIPTTASVYLQTLLEELSVQLGRSHSSGRDIKTSLKALNRMTGMFRDLILTTKLGKGSQRAILKTLMKSGRQFVDTFSKKWLPLLESNFRDHNQIVLDIVKDMQKGTRQMQVICAHGKVVKDVAIASLVPNRGSG